MLLCSIDEYSAVQLFIIHLLFITADAEGWNGRAESSYGDCWLCILSANVPKSQS